VDTPLGSVATGRYIRIGSNSPSAWIAFREVEIYDTSHNKIPITAVGASGSYLTNVPANAVDGTIVTNWNSGSYNSWITLDLGAVKNVSKIRLDIEGAYPYASTYTISSSNDNVNFTTVKSFAATLATRQFVTLYSYGSGYSLTNRDITFNFNGVANSSVLGTNQFDWKMVRDGEAWFGDTCSKTLTVAAIPSPTGVSASCPAPGNNFVINFTVPAGLSYYYVRIYDETTGATYYPSWMAGTGAQTFTWNGATPGHTYSYWIHTTNSAGTPWSPEIPTAHTALVACQAPATATISANPASIPYNTTSTLNWSYTGATSCTITPPASIGSYPSGSGSVSTGNLTASRTYTITCNPGAVTRSTTVTVASPSEYTLSVIKSGQGTVSSSPAGINCGSGCSNQSANFVQDTTVTLTATPGTHRIFTGWGQDCTSFGINPVCTLNMTGNKAATANFAVDPTYKEF
jgi:hypothetical protein